ncbi:uncharacterized protein BXIN_1533 [Babesia sp. Xinjiang]|uniref:uncharacterized protein n=1 Tax=Babesia sp. Xinjiang TaxID=462227 RepID=UPI000A233021|nr:uncharacterized protein BXIN_1533 [Babesia sp. Xinjiang]ORM42293.1 hypothetical protein BXIN_1533 [Babesia sp. Xinjiang]
MKAVEILREECNGENIHQSLHCLQECLYGTACGKYLFCLSWYNFSNFAATYKDRYLSWIVYLTEYLRRGLQQLLDDFNGLDCEHCKGPRCQREQGDHGDENSCFCKSMVECAVALPTLYSYWFTYNSAAALNRGRKQCHKFSQQLENVVNNEVFDTLTQRIKEFFEHLRYPFILYTGVFWLLLVTYFLYGLLIPLDVLHMLSQRRFTDACRVLPMLLLGKKLAPANISYLIP